MAEIISLIKGILPKFIIKSKYIRKLYNLIRRSFLTMEAAKNRLFNPYITSKKLEEFLILSDKDSWLENFQHRLSPRFFWESNDASFRNHYQAFLTSDQKAQILNAASKICAHDFDLLGSGSTFLGKQIDWHTDFKSGARWVPNQYYKLIPQLHETKGSDVKIPWELSRFQHLPTLGKAFWLTEDRQYVREFVDQFTDWRVSNPPRRGVNWNCTMDVAIRAVNLIWAYHFFRHSHDLHPEFHRDFLCSMVEHGEHIVANLEFSHHQGRNVTSNHYLANIVGLTYLGLLFPEIKSAEQWCKIGIQELEHCMDEQVNSDGSNFESSIPYHRLVLEMFVSSAILLKHNNIKLSETFWAKLQKMFEYVLHYTRPDGKAPQIGDADDGRLHILGNCAGWDKRDHRYLLSIGASLFLCPQMKASSDKFSEDAYLMLGEKMFTTFEDLPVSLYDLNSVAYRDAGIYIMRHDNCQMIVTAGCVGTGGIGNHKHNDILSFELNVNGTSFIVDPGSYIYTAIPKWRNLFRSTIYHNTIRIDEEEQNQFEETALFSLTERAFPQVLTWETNENRDIFDAEHYGYMRLSDPVVHKRCIIFDKQTCEWHIQDHLLSKGEDSHKAEWAFHFDNDVEIELCGNTIFAWKNGITMEMILPCASAIKWTLEDSWVSYSYGIKKPSKTLLGVCQFASQFENELLIRVKKK